MYQMPHLCLVQNFLSLQVDENHPVFIFIERLGRDIEINLYERNGVMGDKTPAERRATISGSSQALEVRRPCQTSVPRRSPAFDVIK